MTAGFDGSDRTRLQRRVVGVLFASTVAARAAFTLSFAVAALVVEDMLGSPSWAGLSTVAVSGGTALGSGWLSGLMMRRGRRPGLVVGFGAGVVGGVLAAIGADLGFLVVYLAGLALAGVGAAAANLARYAAADLARPEARARSISFIVFASTIGAVGGPTAVDLADRLGRDLGMAAKVGPLVGGSMLLAVAACVVAVALRPDPLVVAGGIDPVTRRSTVAVRSALGEVAARPAARLAFTGLVVSQAVMVGVMAMTPLHMDAHGHELGTIGWVISAHTAGMFALAPVAGWITDRVGPGPTIAAGAGVLTLATTITAFASEATSTLMFPGLFLLGLGWSLAFVAGSALLVDALPDHVRVDAQGAADLVAHATSGAAALVSGLVLSSAGFAVLSICGMTAAAALVVTTRLSETRSTGTWTERR